MPCSYELSKRDSKIKKQIMPRKVKFPDRDDVTNRTIDSFGDLDNSPRSDEEDDSSTINNKKSREAKKIPNNNNRVASTYSSMRFSQRHDSDEESQTSPPSRRSSANGGESGEVSTDEIRNGGYFCGSGSAVAKGYYAVGNGIYFVADKLFIAPTRYMFGWQKPVDSEATDPEREPINGTARPALITGRNGESATNNLGDDYGSNIAEASDHDRSAIGSEVEGPNKNSSNTQRTSKEYESAAVSRIASAMAAKSNIPRPSPTPPPPPTTNHNTLHPSVEQQSDQPAENATSIPLQQPNISAPVTVTDRSEASAPKIPKSNAPPKPRGGGRVGGQNSNKSESPPPNVVPTTTSPPPSGSGGGVPVPSTTFNRNIATLRELKAILTAMGPFLPVTIKIDTQIGTMLNKASSANGLKNGSSSRPHSNHQSKDTLLLENDELSHNSHQNGSGSGGGGSPADETLIDIHVSVLGPIRFQPPSANGQNEAKTPASFGLPFDPTLTKAEDLIIEDFLLGHSNRRITAVTISDIDFTAALNSAGLNALSSPSRNSFGTMPDELSSADQQHIHRKVLHFINAMIGGGSNGGDEESKNVEEALGEDKLSPCSEITFHRCMFSPLQLQDAFAWPKDGTLQSLSFNNCPLADPHVSTLVRLCRRYEGMFVNLRVLRLARGNISSSVLQALLRFFDEEVETPRLCEIEVPSGLVPIVLRNPLTQRLPRLLVNGKTAPK